MTPLQLHRERWSSGCGHECCGRAQKVVLCRGKLPCDILFVGEAPGASEDSAGVPFWGPAGALLDDMILEAFDGFDVRWAFTNLVGCLPSGDDGRKNGEPSAEQIKSCRPRLTEFVGLAKPRMVVWVGTCADKHGPAALIDPVARTDKRGKPQVVNSVLIVGGKVEGHAALVRWTSIQHPAFILRSVQAQRGLAIQRVVVTLRSAVRKLLEGE